MPWSGVRPDARALSYDSEIQHWKVSVFANNIKLETLYQRSRRSESEKYISFLLMGRRRLIFIRSEFRNLMFLFIYLFINLFLEGALGKRFRLKMKNS